MSLKILVLVLNTERPVEEEASKLRGYIASKFREYPVLHHHINETGYLYTYPKVQYKILGGTPMILGIEEGAEVLKAISGDITELKPGKSSYRIRSVQMTELNAEFGPCRETRHYKFITPWLALNAGNYTKFKQMNDWADKKRLLNSILTGNILSMCKGLDFVVDKKLRVRSHLEEQTVSYKNIPLLGFTGEFELNFKLPDFVGLGKGVSQGFGTVKK